MRAACVMNVCTGQSDGVEDGAEVHGSEGNHEKC